MPVQTYHQLEVWQKAMDLAVHCYQVTRPFPKEEIYGLTRQIRRAASSIPANIAEGQGRNSTKDFLHFLAIARGSLNELETHLTLSERLQMLATENLETMLQETNQVGRMLNGLIRSLEQRL